MDVIDVKILEVLQENSRVSISELSRKVNLSVRCERKTEKTRKFKHYQQVYGDFGSEASGQGSVCDDQHRSGIHLADTGFSRICGDGAGDLGMSLYNGRV